MEIKIALPTWDHVAEWNRRRNTNRADDHAVKQFILDNEPAGTEDILWRQELEEMLQRVAEEAITAYAKKLDDYFEAHWDNHYFALSRLLDEKQEEGISINFLE